MSTINQVKDFWERNLCFDSYLESDFLSKEYFLEGDKLRYKYHYHIPEAIDRFHKMIGNGSVLEIGLGIGSDTHLLASKGFKMTAIDLTEKSVMTVRRRFNVFNLQGQIQQGNAEKMDFPSESFDGVYSFGVLHHTPNTETAVKEVHRVLKKGGVALIMLYHTNSLNYWVHKITNTSYDGTKADWCPEEKTYTKSEVQKLFSDFSKVEVYPEYLFGTGYKQVNYVVPLLVKKIFAKSIGWHLMIFARK